MDRSRVSIRWSIFGYLLIFCCLLLVFVWLFQTVLLDDFYKMIKVNDVKGSAAVIKSNIDSESLPELSEHLSEVNDLSIEVLDENMNALLRVASREDGMLRRMPPFEKLRLVEKTLEVGGEYIEYIASEEETELPPVRGAGFFAPADLYGRRSMTDSILYAFSAKDAAGNARFVLISSVVSPVDATVQTILFQLRLLSIIMIVLSVILAFLIARRVSRPIVSINRSAKILATGDYSVNFQGKGYREITELSETLNYASKELSKVDSLKNELIANISHDLRTPLTLIEGYGEAMRDLPDENTPENIGIIIDETKRLSSLVNDVLDLSQMQAGVQELSLARFNLTRAVGETIERFKKLCAHDGYRIDFFADEEVCVTADALRISQVIYNLINNAITYTGEDKQVTVRQIIEKDSVRIEVQDTGDGISEEALPYIWERYYKEKKSHKRAKMGTGLGLSIVKSVLDLHEGAKYGVESTPGAGSVFWFSLKESSD